MADMVWLRHREHGGVAAFPQVSVAQWKQLGWEPCDAPVEVDPTLVEYTPPPTAPPPAEEPQPVDEPARPAEESATAEPVSRAKKSKE